MANIYGTNRPIKRVGAVEADIFVINDIALTIAPSQIQIKKQAFNHEWSTLRTTASQKAKSGHSIVHVTLSIIFSGEGEILYKLRPLIAGLRATPFCTVHNLHLEKMLLSPDSSDSVEVNDYKKYKGFRAIALALASASVGTVPGKPDCLSCNLQFIWFNYFPYTPIFAYKTGEMFDRPGYAWESDVWKKFYEPFLLKTRVSNWPHTPGSVPSTRLMWREFLLVPQGDTLTNQAAEDLINTLIAKPRSFLDEFSKLAGVGSSSHEGVGGAYTHSNEGKVSLDNQEILDTLYRNLIKKNMNVNQELRKRLKGAELGSSLSSVAGPLLSTIMRRITPILQKQGVTATVKTIQSKEMGALKRAAGILKRNISTLQKLDASGLVMGDEANAEGYKKLTEVEAKWGTPTNEALIGKLSLLGRKNDFTINPDMQETGERTIIEQINITFTNNLAIIPMIGYRYPTCQHTGGMSIDVSFVINSTNEDAKRLNEIYDTVETMALRYKQVPQGYLNLVVKNDFLELFGIKEFITKDIFTDTLPDQPGRSRILLTLTQAGVSSDTKLEDHEKIQREFIRGSEATYREIWKIFEKYLKEEGTKTYQGLIGRNVTSKKELDKLTGWEQFRLTRKFISEDLRDAAFIKLLDRAIDNYNEFIKKVHFAIYESSSHISFIAKTASGQKAYAAAILALKEDSEEHLFIPGMERVKKTLKKRDEEFRIANMKSRQRWTKPANPNDAKAQIHYAKQQRKLGVPEKKVRALLDKAQGIISKEKAKQNEMGLKAYLANQRQLFQEIIHRYRYLDQFKSIREAMEREGFGKGITAYPDFREQVSSVIGLVQKKKSVNAAQLLEYEPDTYMWYPIYDGGTASPTGLIDPHYISAARQLSERSFNSAQGAIDNFFQNTYRDVLKGYGEGHVKKLDELTKKAGHKGTLAPALYQGKKWSSSSRGEEIRKTVNPDAAGKLPINFPPENTRILCDNECFVTTEISQLWEGTNVGANLPPGSTERKQELNNRHGLAGTHSSRGTRGNKSAVKNYVAGFKVKWPRPDSEQTPAVKNGIKFFCPLASYSGKGAPLRTRDLGINTRGFGYRRSIVLNAWKNDGVRVQLVKHKFSDPWEAQRQMGKSLKKWTYEEYMRWKKGRGRNWDMSIWG